MRFGTDGVRGRAFDDLTIEGVRLLGAAAARVIGGDRFYVGLDTRESGPAFQRALAEGMAAGGIEMRSLGVAPTPAVAWLCAADRIPGAMISASHNPYGDNGIKLFAADGLKLSDPVQDRIQHHLDTDDRPAALTPSIVDASSAVGRWADAIVASVDESFDGLRVAIDCANGAASSVAADIFGRLGVELDVIHAAPDGRNINDRCGSTHPQALQELVRGRADLGFAFDGDADRVLAVADDGSLVDGDQIIAVCAVDRHKSGNLAGDTVVVTVMTNLGFRLGMEAAGIEVVETRVGDRYVLEALDAGGWTLGGEQSGHVIFRDLATTGDGILTAVQLLDVVWRRGRRLRDLAGDAMRRLPQVLRNVEVSARIDDLDGALAEDVAAAERRLGHAGRVLIRSSGTEPIVRVMVEADDVDLADVVASELAEAVHRLASGSRGVSP